MCCLLLLRNGTVLPVVCEAAVLSVAVRSAHQFKDASHEESEHPQIKVG